ncbi:MAG: PepSY domain-containing protein [Gammaproteobacteria bacterium]
MTFLLSTLATVSTSNNQPSFILSSYAAQQKITEDQAANIASKATGGQVLGSETKGVKGVTVYRIKVLMKDGRVKTVQVNAASGEVQ